MDEMLIFRSRIELASEQARQGSEAAAQCLGRWRRRTCELARALDEGAYSIEQGLAVRAWLAMTQPLLFGNA